jgi:hypothetical protein
LTCQDLRAHTTTFNSPHNNDNHHRLGFQSDASKKGRDAIGATVAWPEGQGITPRNSALHKGEREPIDRRFQGRMRHPKASPSSVLGTQLLPWRLTSVRGVGQCPYSLCRPPPISEANMALLPPIKPLATNADGQIWPHAILPHIEVTADCCCWFWRLSSSLLASPASMPSPDPRAPTPNHQYASMRLDLTGRDGFAIHESKSEDRRPRRRATISTTNDPSTPHEITMHRI